MNGKLLAVLRQDIDAFEEKIYEFTNGEIDRKAYKGFSGGFGSYAQRENGYSMLRLRLPGGRLTKERLGFIAECAEKYSVPRMKLTTCQTIQMHDLPPQSVVEIMKRALDYDIITRGGVKLVDKKPMPAYMLYAGGCDAQGAEQFGQELGMMLEQDIPAFLAELGRAVRASDGTFAQWYPAHEAEFKEIAERYIAD